MKHSEFQGIYCNNLYRYSRWKTREVKVGDIGIGGNHPIRVQSMTTTDTMDTAATVAQSIRMIEAGCELVRITAPSIHEARNLENIRKELRKQGYTTPLVADIHFTPNAAEAAARIVEKVRVNPGNYADKKKFETHDYSDAGYEAELDRIRERFTPLVKICKEYGTAMRIGTNHGSLSDRILSRYGDTPHGMVESAMEFLRICEAENYHNLVLSMKSSNPQVMVHAYRLLIKTMMAEGMNYPLHLGVTEAGDGEDGRIKSAAGIGTLLEDGIGDTIRVSLTEDPEFEIPVARALVDRYRQREEKQKPIEHFALSQTLPYSPFDYIKRPSRGCINIGANHVPVLVADYSHRKEITPAALFAVGYHYNATTDKWNINDQACDYIYSGKLSIPFALPGTLSVIQDYLVWENSGPAERHFPLLSAEQFISLKKPLPLLHFAMLDLPTLNQRAEQLESGMNKHTVFVLQTSNEHGMAEQRTLFAQLLHWKSEGKYPLLTSAPVILQRSYEGLDELNFQLNAATDFSALLLEGFGEGIWMQGNGIVSEKKINSTGFGILQATRTRISKTDYISCPSCGRTLFDLQETTAKIRARTNHLKGIKIGIMGCIVNGPGEMADADYGYVGTGPGKITLYKGREVVQRNLEEAKAVDALVGLIQSHGDWIEPSERLSLQASEGEN